MSKENPVAGVQDAMGEVQSSLNVAISRLGPRARAANRDQAVEAVKAAEAALNAIARLRWAVAGTDATE